MKSANIYNHRTKNKEKIKIKYILFTINVSYYYLINIKLRKIRFNATIYILQSFIFIIRYLVFNIIFAFFSTNTNNFTYKYFYSCNTGNNSIKKIILPEFNLKNNIYNISIINLSYP